MKRINVVAAVIVDGDRVFATQRAYGEFKGGWEFPGGKIEEGESPEDALIREIKEELDAQITVGEFLQKIECDYPSFHLSMSCFRCELESKNVTLKEHAAAKWLTKDELDTVEWLPADLDIIPTIYKML